MSQLVVDPRIPHPSLFAQPPSEWCPGRKNRVYAVIEGRPPGMYIDWIQCSVAVANVKSAKYKGYKFWSEAYEKYEAAYNSGTVRYGELKGDTPGRSAANPLYVYSRDNTPAPNIPPREPTPAARVQRHTSTPPARTAPTRTELPTPAATQARTTLPPTKPRATPATSRPRNTHAPNPSPAPQPAPQPILIDDSPAPRKKPTATFRPDPSKVYVIEDSPSPDNTPITLRTHVQGTGFGGTTTLSANVQTIASSVSTLSSQVQIGGATMGMMFAEASTTGLGPNPRTPARVSSSHTSPRSRHATPAANPSTPGPISSCTGRSMGNDKPRAQYESPEPRSSPSSFSSQPYSPPTERFLFPRAYRLAPAPVPFNASGSTTAHNAEEVQFTVSFTVGPTPPRPSPARIQDPSSPLGTDEALQLFSQDHVSDNESYFNGDGYEWGPDPSPEDLERLYEHETRTPPPLNSPAQSPPARARANRSGRGRYY